MAEPVRRGVQCFRNADEIGEYIGESGRVVPRLVLEENLPAWKRNGTGPWRAIDLDLDAWMVQQSRKYRPRSVNDAQNDPQEGVNM